MSNRTPEHVRSSFALRRAIFWALGLALGVVFALAVFASEDGAKMPAGLAFAGVGGVIVYALYALVAWRCPACDRHLGSSMNPDACPGCGVRFR